MVRQTNVIWVVYILGEALLHNSRFIGGRQPGLSQFVPFLRNMLFRWKYVLETYWGYLLIIVGFVCFVKINGARREIPSPTPAPVHCRSYLLLIVDS